MGHSCCCLQRSGKGSRSFGCVSVLCVCPACATTRSVLQQLHLCFQVVWCFLVGWFGRRGLFCLVAWFVFLMSPFIACESCQTGCVQLCHQFIELEQGRRLQGKILVPSCVLQLLGGQDAVTRGVRCRLQPFSLLYSHRLENVRLVLSRCGSRGIWQVWKTECILC